MDRSGHRDRCAACDYKQDLSCATCTEGDLLDRWETRRQLQLRAVELKSRLAHVLREKHRKNAPPSSNTESSGDGRVAGVVTAARVRQVVEEMRGAVLPALHAKRLSLHQRRFALARRQAVSTIRAQQMEASRRQARIMHELVETGLRWHLKESIAALMLRRWERVLDLFSMFQVEIGSSSNNSSSMSSQLDNDDDDDEDRPTLGQVGGVGGGVEGVRVGEGGRGGGVRVGEGEGRGVVGVASILGLPLPSRVELWPCMPRQVVASALLLTCRLVEQLAATLALSPLPHPLLAPYHPRNANNHLHKLPHRVTAAAARSKSGGGRYDRSGGRGGGGGGEWAAVGDKGPVPSVLYLLLPPWGDDDESQSEDEGGDNGEGEGGDDGAVDSDDNSDSNGHPHRHSDKDHLLDDDLYHEWCEDFDGSGNGSYSNAGGDDDDDDDDGRSPLGGQRREHHHQRRELEQPRVEREGMESFGTAVALLQTNILNLCIRAEVPPAASQLHPEAVLPNLTALQRHAALTVKKLRDAAAHLPLPAPPEPAPQPAPPPTSTSPSSSSYSSSSFQQLSPQPPGGRICKREDFPHRGVGDGGGCGDGGGGGWRLRVVPPCPEAAGSNSGGHHLAAHQRPATSSDVYSRRHDPSVVRGGGCGSGERPWLDENWVDEEWEEVDAAFAVGTEHSQTPFFSAGSVTHGAAIFHPGSGGDGSGGTPFRGSCGGGGNVTAGGVGNSSMLSSRSRRGSEEGPWLGSKAAHWISSWGSEGGGADGPEEEDWVPSNGGEHVSSEAGNGVLAGLKELAFSLNRLPGSGLGGLS